MTRPTPDLSFVVPVYQEERSLEALVEALQRLMDGLASRYRSEVLLVDDGSSDGSWAMIAAAAARDERFAGVRLSRNFGHQSALTCGYRLARGRAAISLDADLQDPPELTHELLAAWEGGADVVYAVRSSRSGESWFKRASASGFYWLLERLAGHTSPRDSGDFRLLGRRALDVLNGMPEHHRYLRGLVGWLGFATAEVRYRRLPRGAGATKFTLPRMLRFAADAIVSMSITPLRLAYVLAALASLPFLAYLVYNLLLWLVWKVKMVPGWSSLILSVVAFGTAILLVLGVLGEYVGRIYEEVKRRPLFLVRETTGSDERDH